MEYFHQTKREKKVTSLAWSSKISTDNRTNNNVYTNEKKKIQ